MAYVQRVNFDGVELAHPFLTHAFGAPPGF